MAKREAMSPAMLARVAEQFRALGVASRLRLMHHLCDGECSVGRLAVASGLTLANVSKHLGILHRGGWVSRRKDGPNVLYQLADPHSIELCDLMCERLRQRDGAGALAVARSVRRTGR